MNRATDKTLVEDMLTKHTFSQAVIKQATREILEIISEGLIKDGAVTISKFGSFRLKPVAARRGINPQTGAILTIASHRRVIFTPCKALRELIEPNHLPPIPLAAEGESTSTAAALAVQAVEEKSHTGESTSCDDQSQDYTKEVSLQAQVADKPVVPTASETTPVTTENIEAIPKVRQQDTDYEIDLGVFERTGRSRTHQKTAWGVALIVVLAAIMTIVMAYKEPSSSSINMAADNSAPILQSDVQSAKQMVVENTTTKQLEMPQDTFYFREQQHHILHGESLWQLAESYYHEPLLWPYIFKANSGSITNPDHILVGADITIPTLQGTPDNLTNSDQLHIAEAYRLLYDYYSEQNHADAVYAKLMARHYEKNMK